jgi:hypothetical protein
MQEEKKTEYKWGFLSIVRKEKQNIYRYTLINNWMEQKNQSTSNTNTTIHIIKRTNKLFNLYIYIYIYIIFSFIKKTKDYKQTHTMRFFVFVFFFSICNEKKTNKWY